MVSENSNEVITYDGDIKDRILTIRGKQVLLDSDVAQLYGYETKRINETASRNNGRFPERFRFQLNREEADEIMRSQSATAYIANIDELSDNNLKSQFATSSSAGNTAHGGKRKLPYAYTEQGIAMLSGLLKNETAIQVSISIMDAFVEMRQFLNVNKSVFEKLINIDNKILEHDHKFDQVFDLLQSTEEKPKRGIFFKGQFYDAFKLVIDIVASAKKSIVIIDNYLDDSVLEILTKKKEGTTTTLITSNPRRVSPLYLDKFAKQYGRASIISCKDFHDRFIILDNKEVYAVGASLKDLGSKCFEISKNEDTEHFVSYVNGIIESRQENFGVE